MKPARKEKVLWKILALLVVAVIVELALFFGAGATSKRTESSKVELWTGTVTSAGPSTVTVAYSASVASDETELSSQEFSGSAFNTPWIIDNSGKISNSSSATVTFPRLTPTGTSELYFAYDTTVKAASAGTTPGFRYATTSDDNVVAYDTKVSSTVQPTARQGSAESSGGVGVLITRAGPSLPPTPITAVGGLATSSGTGTTTLVVSPKHAGDLLVLAIAVFSPDNSSTSASLAVPGTASSVSGGGVTNWTRAVGPSLSYTGTNDPGFLSNFLFALFVVGILATIVLVARALIGRRPSQANRSRGSSSQSHADADTTGRLTSPTR